MARDQYRLSENGMNLVLRNLAAAIVGALAGLSVPAGTIDAHTIFSSEEAERTARAPSAGGVRKEIALRIRAPRGHLAALFIHREPDVVTLPSPTLRIGLTPSPGRHRASRLSIGSFLRCVRA